MCFAHFCKLSALRCRHFYRSGSLSGPLLLVSLHFASPSAIRAAIKHSGTLGRNKLPLSSTSRPAPTEQLTQARIDEPLLIIRHLCSIRMGFGGEFITLPDSQTASEVAQILYLGYFSSRVNVPVSQLPLLSSGGGS